MPNWCLTNIHISGKKSDIQTLYKRFSDAIERDDGGQEPGYFTAGLTHYGKRWLGNLLLYIGEEIKENGGPRCRGTVSYYDLCDDGEGITIQTDTAWVPMLQVFVKFKNKYAPNAEITYCAEEPGCELFWKNDDSWEDYYVEFFSEETDEKTADKIKEAFGLDGTSTYMYRNEMKESLKQLLNHDGELDDLVEEALDKYDEEHGLRIFKFENIDLCEVD